MEHHPDTKVRRVLVVDDDQASRELMTVLFHECGWHCEVAADGLEGIDKSIKEPFDLVLMDLRMPNLNGYGAAARIHAEKKDLPIFALSAYVMDYIPLKCRAAGMRGLIAKPIDVKLFRQWLAEFE